MLSRRNYLRTSGLTFAGVVLAECNDDQDDLEDDDIQYTTILVQNLFDKVRWVEIRVLDPEADNQTDATWFSEGFPLESSEESDESDLPVSRSFEQAFEKRSAIVQVESRNSKEQFVYYPHCDEDGQGDLLLIQIMTRDSIRWMTYCDTVLENDDEDPDEFEEGTGTLDETPEVGDE